MQTTFPLRSSSEKHPSSPAYGCRIIFRQVGAQIAHFIKLPVFYGDTVLCSIKNPLYYT